MGTVTDFRKKARVDLALVAIVEALGEALPKKQRKVFVERVQLISTDWERTEAPEQLKATSRAILRPTLSMLGAPAP